MNILITSAARRISLIRSFQKELNEVDPKAKVYATYPNTLLSAASQVGDANFKPPGLGSPNYIDV